MEGILQQVGCGWLVGWWLVRFRWASCGAPSVLHALSPLPPHTSTPPHLYPPTHPHTFTHLHLVPRVRSVHLLPSRTPPLCLQVVCAPSSTLPPVHPLTPPSPPPCPPPPQVRDAVRESSEVNVVYIPANGMPPEPSFSQGHLGGAAGRSGGSSASSGEGSAFAVQVREQVIVTVVGRPGGWGARGRGLNIFPCLPSPLLCPTV